MACERQLLADLDEFSELLGDAMIERPILLVVPSRSLRLHLLDRIVAHRADAVLGIRCLTLFGLAVEITARGTAQKQPDTDLLPILARRHAAREASLRSALGHLHDGYASVVRPVEDLLEAGFETALAEALDEVLVEEGPERASHREVERARALVRTAGRCLRTLSAEGVTRVTSLLQQAAEQIRLDPSEPPASTVMVYGFADATGVATDLIEALLSSWSGTLYLDQPPDPAWPDRVDEGVAFGRRFEERLALVTGPPRDSPASRPPGSIQMFQALGGQAEIRQVAERIRGLLDAGARPEGIGFVARRIEPYVSLLRTHFWRLGIPFSATGAVGPRTGEGRLVRAVLDLLGQGREAPVDRWLDASLSRSDQASFDLRLAFFGQGAGRLEEAAALDLERYPPESEIPLPVRGGSSSATSADGSATGRLDHRRIPMTSLSRARDEALRLCQRLGEWQQAKSLDRHLRSLESLLLEDLQWPSDGELAVRLIGAATRLSEQTRPELPLSFDEMAHWLEEAWAKVGRDALGGAGGGVQILDVIEARGRTFDHLFVAGLNRGVFPRIVREDPLLPDSLRQVLSREGYGVLPDLPRRLAGFDEERFLFAQLVSSSPSVTLSWQLVDDQGQPLSVSPLVERMRWSEGAEARESWRKPPTAQPLFPLTRRTGLDLDRAPRLAYEHAVDAALWAGREHLGEFLTAALEESGASSPLWGPSETSSHLPIPSPARVATARVRILDEMDPNRADSEGQRTFGRLGPYFGFLGAVLDSRDPRFDKRLYVTALENLSGCPWQTFLLRLLRLEALPDPLEVLPAISPVLVGDLVHRCLERLVASQLSDRVGDLEAARTLSPQTVVWPSEQELDGLLDQQAEVVARRHGIGMRGFSKMLARVVRPYLAEARKLQWTSGDGVPAVAVEVEGSLALPLPDGQEQRLYFKADRLDVDDSGEHLVDYKTGKNDISSAATAATRHQNLIKRIRSGQSLQAVTYAQAAVSETSTGRYLFLKPDLDGPDSSRSIGIDRGDLAGQKAFHQVTSTLLAAWTHGSFFPRLVEADRDRAPRRCEFCEVAEACLRYDSGARGRLRSWMERHLDDHLEGSSRSDPAEDASLGVWLLDSRRLAEVDEPEPSADGDS